VHLIIFTVVQEKSFIKQFTKGIAELWFLVSVKMKLFEQQVELYRN
jgi:hypothetical protein